MMERFKNLDTKDYLEYGLTAAIIIGVILAAARYLNGEEVVQALQNFDYIYAPMILGLAALYLVLKAVVFVLLIQPFDDGLRWFVSFKAYIAGQAATLIPGGVAARAGLMKQAGISASQTMVPVMFLSGINQLLFVVGAVIAAFWFPAARLSAAIVLVALTVFTVMVAIPRTRNWIIDGGEWLAEKVGIEEQWCTFIDAIPMVLTAKILIPAVLLSVVALVLKVIALDLSMRGVGLNLGYPTLILGFILPSMLGRIVPVPAGLGVTEASTVAFITATSPADAETVTAAVAVFRIGTVFFEALLGALFYFLVWQGEDEGMAKAETETERTEVA